MPPSDNLEATFRSLVNDFNRVFQKAPPPPYSAGDQKTIKDYFAPQITLVSPTDGAVHGDQNVFNDLARRAPLNWAPNYDTSGPAGRQPFSCIEHGDGEGEVSGDGVFTDKDDVPSAPNIVQFKFHYKLTQNRWILDDAKGTSN